MNEPPTLFELPHPLYPFRLTELADFRHGPYRLVNVFRRITEEQRQACVRMWLEERALPTEEAAWRRSLEVCYLILHAEDGGLVGVNTAYVDRYPPQNAHYFFNRMFIRPAHRAGRLMIAGTAAAVCHLSMHHAREGLRGVVNVNENPKLFRSSVHQIFAGGGYRFDGLVDGRENWRLEFDSIRFADSPPAGEASA